VRLPVVKISDDEQLSEGFESRIVDGNATTD